MVSLRKISFTTLGALLLWPCAAFAVTPQLQPESGKPILLSANQIDYDSARDFIIAQGKVEVTQNDNVLLADTLAYDQKNERVYAQGNVTIMDASGNVFFAEDAELTDDMRQGVSSYFKARLKDGSLLAANEAVRVNENVTELHKAVYSPCSIICGEGKPKEPTWAMNADKATVDREKQTLTYHDASMEILGVPVMYTPYLSHALPGADNSSGLLTPTFERNDNLGTTVKVPVYYSIDPSKDITLTPMYTSDEAPVLFGEYRQKLNEGDFKFRGSATNPKSRDAAGNPEDSETFRGHIFGAGNFALTPDINAGFDVSRTTDDTYLRKYRISNSPLLTSRVYGEAFNFVDTSKRTYAMVQGLAFQGLQQQDDSKQSPWVLPQAEVMYESEPLANGSRVSFTGNVMSLTRDVGAKSHRMSLVSKWGLPYISEDGHVIEVAAQLRTDGYFVDDVAQTTGTYQGFQGRAIPQVSLDWRYPLINRFENASWVVEPVVNLIASQNGGNSAKIPNEDSAVPEFTDTNLFSDNRFPGLDRLETGPRINYGLRSEYLYGSKTRIGGLVGQSYRVSNNPLFPLSNDLRSRYSDYVGRAEFGYDWLNLAYRFRIDKDDFEPNRREVDATLLMQDATFLLSYLSIHKDPILSSKKEIGIGGSYKLSNEWSIGGVMHRDLQLDRLSSINGGITYQNECITLLLSGGRDLTRDRDFKQSTSINFQVLFKNIN